MNSVASIPRQSTKDVQCKRTASFGKATPLLTMKLPDRINVIELFGEKGCTVIEALLKNGKIKDDSSVTIETKEGRLVTIGFAEDKQGRQYIDEIEIDGNKFENIQFYIGGGFAIDDGEFLGLDELVLNGRTREMTLQDDSHRPDLDKDIDLKTGEIRKLVDDEKEKCLSCSNGKISEDKQNKRCSDYDLWFGEDMKPEHKLEEEREFQPSFEYVAKEYLVLDKIIVTPGETSSTVEDIAQTNFDEEGAETIAYVENCSNGGESTPIPETEELNQDQTTLPENQEQKVEGTDHIAGDITPIEYGDSNIEIISYDDNSNSGNSSAVPAVERFDQEQTNYTKSPEEAIALDNGKNFDAREFSEEESPIVRCIMDPAFRKIYGAMYGFIEPDEYEVGEVVGEVPEYRETRTDETVERLDDHLTQESRESVREEIDENKEEKKPETKQESKKKEKKGERKDRKIPEKKAKGKVEERKNKPESELKKKKGKKKPIEPLKLEKNRKKNLKVFGTQLLPQEMQKSKAWFEQFLAKELKMSKIKIEQFKLVLNQLKNEIKQEVKQLILKVQEFFKIKENLQKLKQELGNNWVLTYTKIKLQKIVFRIEHNIEKLKKEIKVKIEKIRVNIREIINKRLARLKLDERIKLLRKIERVLLIFLLLKIFKEK